MNDVIENAMSLHHRLDSLRAEHRQLDDSIAMLFQDPASDDLRLRRLKKQKLMVRDRITLIERMLDPDMPA
ncbi:MAG TPA: YdcH family protein [Rhodocyclaceae bacterium]|nr:YdcH family protein [Rhodocyclaceae bacterium]